MTDDFPNQLRKQFSMDRVYETPDFVMALYVNERDHAADIIEDQQKRIEQLVKRLRVFAELNPDLTEALDRIKELEAALTECKEMLDVAFDYDGDVFGISHNRAVDAAMAACAALGEAKGE